MAEGSLAPALLGGTAIGAAAATNVIVFGRVLGASGYLGRVVTGKRVSDVGLLLGIVLSGYIGQPFFVPPTAASVGVARLIAGGALVGTGTALANGCTSGHGVCGVSRLRKRSLVAVLTFGAFASAVSQVSGTSAKLLAVGAQFERTPALARRNAEIVFGLSLYLLAAVLLMSRFLARSEAGRAIGPLILPVAIGLAFGGGLLASGMALPLKVSTFFDFGRSTWDPSLAAVALSATVIASIGFLVTSKKTFMGTAAELPPREGSIDRGLVVGSALFGTGWAIAGVCPGPAITMIGSALRLASRGSYGLAYNVAAFGLPLILSTYATSRLKAGERLLPSWPSFPISTSKRSRPGKRGVTRAQRGKRHRVKSTK